MHLRLVREQGPVEPVEGGAAPVDPREDECLLCYLHRTLEELGCDTTLRWARRYRDLVAPRATALEGRLASAGGFCDCEVFLNGWQLAREHCVRDVHTDELSAPDRLPGCEGARRGSTQPCRLWVRQRRRWEHPISTT